MKPIECGGCAPPVFVETERQQDQRIADRMRVERAAAAERVQHPVPPTPPAFCPTHGTWWAPGCVHCDDDLPPLSEAFR